MKKITIVLLAVLLLLSLPVSVSATDYDALTDKELYAAIDRMMEDERERGKILIDMPQTMTVEEMKAVLDALDIPTDFKCEYLYGGFTDDPEHWFYGKLDLMAPETRMREYLFALMRSEQVENVDLNYYVFTTEIPAPEGDVNYDWKVDAKDYMVLKRYVLGTLSESFLNNWRLNRERIDVNYDGEVNGKDFMMLKRAVMDDYVLGRPAIKKMNKKQLNYWLDEREKYAKDSNKYIVFLNEGVTEEQAVQAIGTNPTVLYCSEMHYPDDPLWIVIEFPRETFRETVKQIGLSELIDGWGSRN